MELDGKKNENLAITIFLVGLFVFLFVMILTQGARVYNSSKAETQKSPQMIGCLGVSFSLSYIEYKEGLLSFQLRNMITSDREIDNLTIISGSAVKSIGLKGLGIGDKKEITNVDILISNNTFSAFADDCVVYQRKYKSVDGINFS